MFFLSTIYSECVFKVVQESKDDRIYYVGSTHYIMSIIKKHRTRFFSKSSVNSYRSKIRQPLLGFFHSQEYGLRGDFRSLSFFFVVPTRWTSGGGGRT